MISIYGKNGWFEFDHLSIKKLQGGPDIWSLRLWSGRPASHPPVKIDGTKSELVELFKNMIGLVEDAR